MVIPPQHAPRREHRDAPDPRPHAATTDVSAHIGSNRDPTPCRRDAVEGGASPCGRISQRDLRSGDALAEPAAVAYFPRCLKPRLSARHEWDVHLPWLRRRRPKRASPGEDRRHHNPVSAKMIAKRWRRSCRHAAHHRDHLRASWRRFDELRDEFHVGNLGFERLLSGFTKSIREAPVLVTAPPPATTIDSEQMRW